MTKDTEALREALADKGAMEKVAILSNEDWPIARVDAAATLDMIHEIAVEAIYPSSANIATPASDVAPVACLPETIGRLHLGEHRASNERLCNDGHTIPDGHPLYWPQSMGEHDDYDPCCLAHAIEQAESDSGWCATCLDREHRDAAAHPPLAQSVDPVAGGEALREAAQKVADMLGKPSDGRWPQNKDAIRMTHDWPVWMLKDLHDALASNPDSDTLAALKGPGA